MSVLNNNNDDNPFAGNVGILGSHTPKGTIEDTLWQMDKSLRAQIGAWNNFEEPPGEPGCRRTMRNTRYYLGDPEPDSESLDPRRDPRATIPEVPDFSAFGR
jgi:hypothetical protein